jgi:phosphoribosyl 1,2-cyclic phosphate phosphodiesterase
MQIRLIGTGAADGIPAFFADSEVSRYARKHGGKDVRTRCAALIDGTIKIDLPPETFMQCVAQGLDPQDWSALVFTHSHEDHCAVSELQYGLIPFTTREFLEYPIYCNAEIKGLIRARYPKWPLEVVETKSFCSFHHEDYTITPFAANHKEDEDSQNLLFQRSGKTLIYATDTGIWNEPTWAFLRDYQADLLVIECTDGYHPTPYQGHLGLESCIGVVDRLRKQGTLRPDSRVITTHHAHTGGATHSQLKEALAPHGMEPGFDGMVVEI